MSTPHEADDINTTITTTTTSHAAAPPQPTVQSSSEAHQSHRLSFTVALPIPHSPSVPLLTPTAEATERTNWLSAPASARTSFTRVDQTRAGTPVLEEDDGSGGGSGNASSSHVSADGAQADAPHPTEPEPEPAHPEVPQASVTFLLVSGRRRNMLFEPETTIGRVKELVWNTWPAGMHLPPLPSTPSATLNELPLSYLSDWQDERPPAPAYLRILFRGRVLQDDDTLTGTFFFLPVFHFREMMT
jgi:hypothetical protein